MRISELKEDRSEPDAMPEKIDPDAMPEKIDPDAMPEKIDPDAMPEKIDPDAIPEKIDPDAMPEKIDPDAMPEKIDPDAMPEKIDPDAIPEKIDPDAMPEKIDPDAMPEKIDHTVSTMPAAEEVNVKNGRTAAAFAKIGKAVATPLKSSCSYGFATLAKIGYVVRVRVVYRIMPSMSDDVETLISVYPANFPLNSTLRQSDGGEKFISGQDAGTPLKNECGDSDTYKFRFLTFSRMGYTATVEVFDRIGHWMASPEAKSTMIMYTTILAKNARYYALQHDHKFANGKAAFLIILSNTLIEILNEPIWAKEKAGAQEEYVSGSQELMKSASVDGHDWFSAAYKILKDILGVIPLNEILVFMVKEFRAFLRKAPSIFSKEFLTMESLGFMMREFFVFMMKQFFGAQFISYIDELVVLVLRELFGINLVNGSGFSGSASKGRKKKKK